MKTSSALAIEVLLEDGLIEKYGTFYRFKDKLTVEDRAIIQTKESEGQLVVAGKLPWLTERGPESTYNPRTPEQRLMCAYKLSKKINWQDRTWDSFNYKRYSKACKKLLAAFNGNDEEAAVWLLDFGSKFDDDELTWNLDTAANHGWNEKGAREAR
jgi:hypothetical protein